MELIAVPKSILSNFYRIEMEIQNILGRNPLGEKIGVSLVGQERRVGWDVKTINN
jgi:hypothetical protein